MSDFRYEIPNENNFLRAVRIRLEQKGLHETSELLTGCTCSITHSGNFSGARWNAFWTTVRFSVPIDRYKFVSDKLNGAITEEIRKVCDEVMPPKCGLDIMDIQFAMSLEDAPTTDLFTELQRISDDLSLDLRSQLLPEDIKDKAKEMSEVYTYLYCVENALRTFIEIVAKNHFGTEYLDKLQLNTDMRKKIRYRKKSQERKKWLSVRGDSDIFYLDIEDLGCIIRNNWGIFNSYFESQQWITTNINEIADCRNPIAHNSYLTRDEREIIRINFIKILKQINDAFTNG